MFIMNNVLSATEARNNFFELLNLVAYKGEKFTIEKDGSPVADITPSEARKSPEERKKILADFRKVFAKSAKRKYWSVIDTPAWKKKERKYLEDLSKGIIR
ncbi:MAG: type II toxin-antitoxin system prevent-host-death family antitoxin [Candidatus Marinimicrobia bacterium]|nr:type II toxin-antitoxin system prevent-host-death family antitoxin [Candidatus Neomarinimicrobiota bacterium]